MPERKSEREKVKKKEETELKLYCKERVPCQNKYSFLHKLRRKSKLRDDEIR
jgi:hypothetical protein